MKICWTLLPALLLSAALSCGCGRKGTNPPAHHRQVYLDQVRGNDANSGNIRHPLKTIARLNEIMKERAVDAFLAGGQLFEGTLTLKGRSGTSADTVTISSYGTGRAIINGGNGESIIIDSCSFVSVRNIEIRGNGRKGGNTANGLAIKGSRNCCVEDVVSAGFQVSGIDLYNCRNIVVRKAYAHDNGFCGINVMGSRRSLSRNILIKDSRAENNPGDPAILDNHSGNGILAGVSDSVIIDHCTATNNGWDMPRQGNGPVGIWAWESDHVTIQYCISYRNKTSAGGKDGGGFDLDGGMTNSVIQYCLSYENQGAGYGLFQYWGASDWHSNVVRYCVSINDATTTGGSGSFFIWNGSGESRQLRDCYLYNNVAWNTNPPVISYEGASNHQDFIFENNIFIGGSGLTSGKNTGSIFTGNVWWSTKGPSAIFGYTSLGAWAKATGQEMSGGRLAGVGADPLLKDPYLTEITDPYLLGRLTGYTLRDDSPVRGRGVVIVSKYGVDPPEEDFFGNRIPVGKAAEPGIYQFRK
jgi:hypothetical protein